jgi:outer membrane protein OmpA-like peptidoglycan-associated protein
VAEATPGPRRPRRVRDDRVGAVAIDHQPRRRRFGWLWLLLALIVLGLLLSLLLRGRSDGAPVAAASTSASPTPAATGSAAAATDPAATDPAADASGSPALGAAIDVPTTAPADTAPADTAAPTPASTTGAAVPAPSSATGAAGTPGAVLVGGGTVPVHTATGADATAAGTALFASGSAVLDAPGRQVVAAAAKKIRATKPGSVTVSGYADQVGGQPVSAGLSQQRADAVAAALRTDLGADAPKITTAARVQQDPVASDATAAGRQLNRRATITTGPAAAGTGPAGTGPAGADSGGAAAAGAALIGGGTVPARAATGATATAGGVGTVLFATGSTSLDSASRQVVTAAAAQIRAGKPAEVTVTGYTDRVGGAPRNTDLSGKRADTVAAALRTALGAGAPTITTVAGGERAPIAPNTTADGRQLNRRATITTR